MKKNILRLFIWTSICVTSGCKNQAKSDDRFALSGIAIPIVDSPVMVIRVSAPVQSVRLKSGIAIQDTNQVYFALESTGVKLPDSMIVTGKIHAKTHSRIALLTSGGETIQIAYHLPSSDHLAFTENEMLRIKQVSIPRDASMTTHFSITGEKGIIASRENELSRTPITLEVGKNLAIIQLHYDVKKPIYQSAYDTQYVVPVIIELEGKRIQVDPQKEFLFSYNHTSYKLIIDQSSYIQPSKEFAPSAEARGYFIQYLLLKR